MADVITTLSKLIDPEVLADMVSAKIPKKIRVTPFAKIDTKLEDHHPFVGLHRRREGCCRGTERRD